MVQHHLVVFAANARFLVAAKRGVRGVGVVAVGPHAPGLDGAAHAVGHVAVAAPHTGAQAVQRVVGNGQGLGLVLEGGHGQHGAEDFFLEDAHLVVALEQRGLHVVAAFQVAAQVGLAATGQHFGAFLLAQLQVRQDLGELLFAGLRAHHAVGVQRVLVLDGGHALEHTLHELVVDAFLDQRTRWAGADLALVEREQHQAFNGLVQKRIVLVHHVGKEDVGALAAQLQRGGDEVVGGSLRNHAAGAGRAGERDLGNALAGGQRHAGFTAKAVDDVEHAGRQQVGNQLGQDEDGDGGGFCGLEHHAVARAQGGGQLPCGHQDGEVPRNDLAHHAQRFLDVVRHRVLVDVRQGAFLRAHTARKVAEVIDGERNVGVQRLADGLAVVHGFGIGQQLQVLLDAVGNFQQDVGACGGIGLAPGVCCGVRGIQCQFDVFCGGAGGLGVDLAVDGRDHIKVLALDRGHELAADEVVVLGLVGDLGASGAGGCVNGHAVSPVSVLDICCACCGGR